MREPRVYTGNNDGRRYAVVACRSMAEFCRLTGISRNSCFGRTGNKEDIAQAMTEPGVVFLRSADGPVGGRWERMPPPTAAHHPDTTPTQQPGAPTHE